MNNFFDIIFSLFGYESKSDQAGGDRKNEIALHTFRSKMNENRASSGQHIPQAPGFDYVHWKPEGQHRIKVNHEDDFVLQCRGLKPYVETVAESLWLGREETHWAGMSRPEPPKPLGAGISGSRFGSNMGSRDIIMG